MLSMAGTVNGIGAEVSTSLPGKQRLLCSSRKGRYVIAQLPFYGAFTVP